MLEARAIRLSADAKANGASASPAALSKNVSPSPTPATLLFLSNRNTTVSYVLACDKKMFNTLDNKHKSSLGEPEMASLLTKSWAKWERALGCTANRLKAGPPLHRSSCRGAKKYTLSIDLLKCRAHRKALSTNINSTNSTAQLSLPGHYCCCWPKSSPLALWHPFLCSIPMRPPPPNIGPPKYWQQKERDDIQTRLANSSCHAVKGHNKVQDGLGNLPGSRKIINITQSLFWPVPHSTQWSFYMCIFNHSQVPSNAYANIARARQAASPRDCTSFFLMTATPLLYNNNSRVSYAPARRTVKEFKK